MVWLSKHAGLNSPVTAAGRTPIKSIAGDGILRILGPTFTGSLPSLRRNLKALYDPDLPQASGAPVPPANLRERFPSARILSGSVSNCSAVQWFERELPQETANPPVTTAPWHIDFGTFQENDSVHIYRLMKFLSSQGTPPSDTAILSEDETAYAAREQTDSPCDFPYAQDNRPIHLVFPRDISALRNAYERQAVFDGASSGLKEHAHPILRGEAPSDSGQSEITDTIASSSGSVAAIDQEAYLYGVVSILRNHHSRYLILRCTNPLDFLFLTRFFHRAYPQARIVIVGSDLLFRREIDTTEFRGVLSVSSYPLLPRAQHWSRITEDKWDEQKSQPPRLPGRHRRRHVPGRAVYITGRTPAEPELRPTERSTLDSPTDTRPKSLPLSASPRLSPVVRCRCIAPFPRPITPIRSGSIPELHPRTSSPLTHPPGSLPLAATDTGR